MKILSLSAAARKTLSGVATFALVIVSYAPLAAPLAQANPVAAVGSVAITKYVCPAGTSVTRAQNGVGGTVPEGCIPMSGATFGYAYGSQLDANAPFPELSEPLVAGGSTGVNGTLTIPKLNLNGRYLIEETDANNQRLPDTSVLGLYCQGDGDTSGTNDNQELTFATTSGAVLCVAYDPAPAATTLHVNILKYISNEPATTQSANNASFPMHSSWSDDINSGSGDFALGPTGFSTSTPYAAVTRTMDVPADYAVSETIDNSTVYPAGSQCPAGTFRIVGYRTGDSIATAEASALTTDAPDFHGLTGDKYVLVENEPCPQPPPCNDSQSDVYVSDSTTLFDGNASIAVPKNPAWTSIAGASWIWGEDPTANQLIGETETFTKTFTIAGTPKDSTLTLATDNTYGVYLNGTLLASSSADLDHFSHTESIPVPASMLLPGTNTISFTVVNAPWPTENPAGLDYSLTVNSNQCVTPQVKVHIQKYLRNGNDITLVPDNAGLAPFPMVSTWQAANLNGGAQASGSYTLGTSYGGSASVYGADTAAMDAPVTLYTTHEVTSGDSQVLPVGAQCQAGKYRLVGYRSGNSTAAAESAPISIDAPSFSNFGQDEYVDVINEACDDLTTTVTMCKIDTNEKPLSGWTLTLKGAHVGDYTVEANSITGTTTDPLTAGMSYLAQATGTWLNHRTPLNTVDAEYSTEDNWATHMDGFTGYGPDILDLQANGNFVDWGAYNSNHLYAMSFIPFTAGAGSFNIFDGQDGTPNPSWYTDNTGSLNVSLSQGYAGITGENGCVNFDNVPFGDYVIGEEPQDGWTNVSGLGDVTVSADNNEFTVVNQQAEVGPGSATLTLVKNTDSEDHNGTFTFDLTGATTGSTKLTTVDGATSTDITLTPGDTTITEEAQSGWSLSGAQCVYDNDSVGVAVTNGEQLSVEDGDHVMCTFTNDFVGGGEGGTTHTQSSITEVVHDHDLATTTLDALTNLSKWFMYNDSNDTIVSDPGFGGMITGPGTPPAGSGSIQFTLGASPNDRKNIATYQFGGTPLADISALSFSAYSHSGVAGANESPYLNFNIDFTGGNTWQKRIAYVPSANEGSVPQNSWNTFDAIHGGSAMWYYSGADWPAGATSNGTIPGTTARSWSAILLDYPNSRVLASDPWLGVRVGEPGPSGYTANVDNFSITIDDGTNATTTNVDFEPMAQTQTVINNASELASNSSALGSPYTVKWNVTSSGPGTITGTVMVTVNGGSGCSAAVAAGQCDITPSSPGNYTHIIAHYEGDGDAFAPSDSDPTTHKVDNIPPGKPNLGGGGNGPVNFGVFNNGMVLGTSSENTTGDDQSSCDTPLLNRYLRLGVNAPDQVKLLQDFLNGEMGALLPISGVFGPLTESAVKDFQLKYLSDVLVPWGITDPTGYVYKTTLWKINEIYCAGLNTPRPQVP
jgi:hypothetical protein